MLDQAILNQLKELFTSLESKIQFEVANSNHPSQSQLKDMLNSFISSSPKLSIISSETSEVPFFKLLKEGQHTGVSFKGIPNGHEFTSLILAVLNLDGKGKIPDQGVMNRIASLDEEIDLSTYISLTCTNCPDVIQALNIIAMNNPKIKHTMVDGSLAQSDADKVRIQAVPTVVDHLGTHLHVGKSTLIELLETLEKNYSTNSTSQEQTLEFDVVVIGGGPAGVSSAIYSARKGLRTAIVADKIGGQVRETKGIENLISQTYTEGPQLSADLDKHLRQSDITILENRLVEKINDLGSTKEVKVKNGETLITPSVIFATGAKWRELDIPGEKEYIGRGVAYCPHCDGPFYKGKKVAVIGGGNSGVEAAIDLANTCSQVTLYDFALELKADEVLIQKLKSLDNIKIKTNTAVKEVIGDGEKVTGLEFSNRETATVEVESLDGIFVQIGLAPNSELLKGIAEISPYGEVIIDEGCRTSAKGIYAAGDVSTVPFKQIVIAMGEGAKAALSSFEDRLRG